MCEILGISFKNPRRPVLSMTAVSKKGHRNPDGWGVGFYPDKSAQIIKEPIEAGVSRLSAFMRDYPGLVSNIFVTHVRKSSVGAISHKNTHPFSRELFGKDFVFAHNGDLKSFNDLDTGRFTPVGETDSEHSFCHILNLIETRGVRNWKEEDFNWISERLSGINKLGKFNTIFSDGEFLFCYNDVNDFKDYCHVKRSPPHELITLSDDDFEIILALEDDKEQTGYIVATNPMTDEYWESYMPGEFIVYKDGEIVFRNNPKKRT